MIGTEAQGDAAAGAALQLQRNKQLMMRMEEQAALDAVTGGTMSLEVMRAFEAILDPTLLRGAGETAGMTAEDLVRGTRCWTTAC